MDGEHDARPSDLMRYIRENELGADMSIQTPFGVRQVLYADYTASGRALAFIEDYVRSALLPTYGNTHTSTTKTGRQSSDFVAEVICCWTTAALVTESLLPSACRFLPLSCAHYSWLPCLFLTAAPSGTAGASSMHLVSH